MKRKLKKKTPKNKIKKKTQKEDSKRKLKKNTTTTTRLGLSAEQFDNSGKGQDKDAKNLVRQAMGKWLITSGLLGAAEPLEAMLGALLTGRGSPRGPEGAREDP